MTFVNHYLHLIQLWHLRAIILDTLMPMSCKPGGTGRMSIPRSQAMFTIRGKAGAGHRATAATCVLHGMSNWKASDDWLSE